MSRYRTSSSNSIAPEITVCVLVILVLVFAVIGIDGCVRRETSKPVTLCVVSRETRQESCDDDGCVTNYYLIDTDGNAWQVSQGDYNRVGKPLLVTGVGCKTIMGRNWVTVAEKRDLTDGDQNDAGGVP